MNKKSYFQIRYKVQIFIHYVCREGNKINLFNKHIFNLNTMVDLDEIWVIALKCECSHNGNEIRMKNENE